LFAQAQTDRRYEVNKAERQLVEAEAELRGARRVISMMTAPGLHGTDQMEDAARHGESIIAQDLEDLIMATLNEHRTGSRAYELAAEIARKDPTGKAERIVRSLQGNR
jgi:hypothetical protein